MFERFRNGRNKENPREKLLGKVKPVFSEIEDSLQITTITMLFNFPTLKDFKYYWRTAKKYPKLSTIYNKLELEERKYVSEALEAVFDNFGPETAWHLRHCDIDHFRSKLKDEQLDYVYFLKEALNNNKDDS